MKTTNIFEYATRYQTRFPYKGSVSVEDLWTLSVTELDKIYKVLMKKKKTEAEEESLLSVRTKEDEELEVQIDIIKHIVTVKLEEKDAREQARANKEQRQKLLEIKARRQDAALESMSDAELDAMLAKYSE